MITWTTDYQEKNEQNQISIQMQHQTLFSLTNMPYISYTPIAYHIYEYNRRNWIIFLAHYRPIHQIYPTGETSSTWKHITRMRS